MSFPDKPTIGSVHALRDVTGKRALAIYDESGWRVFTEVLPTDAIFRNGVSYEREVHLARRVLTGPEKL